jgi:hypothetical protein
VSPPWGWPGFGAEAAVLLLLVSSFTGLGAAQPPGAPLARDSVSAEASLPGENVVVENRTIGNLSQFWGTGVLPTNSLDNATNESQTTPINWFVWPAGKIADTYNMSSGQLWTNGIPSQQTVNETGFVRWCTSTDCHAIFTVPGEIDSPSTAAWMVTYTEKVLGFHPALWEVGNEPYGWEHFGIPWNQWSATDSSNVTPAVYAQVVHSYIAAMRAVDPTARFIGLPGVGAGSKPDTAWLTDTVSLNGPNLTAVAIHDYPAERGPPGATLAAFFQTLTNAKTNMQTRITTDEATVAAACPSCRLEFFVDEFGSGTGVGGGWQTYMDTYPQVPYVAAELDIMMATNVSNADLFDLRSSYNGSLFNSTGIALPLDSLYTQILPHLDPTTLATSLSGSVKGVFAQATESSSANSITVLAVNTNTTQPVQLNVSGPTFPSDGVYSLWWAHNSTTSSAGSFQNSTGFQSSSSWVLPPLGVLLVSVCRPGAPSGLGGGVYAVTFCADGLPRGTSWSVTLDGNTVASTASTISFAEPNGSYSFSVGSVPGWRTPTASGTVTVQGAPASVEVVWTAVTYPVTFSESGLPSGTSWSVTVDGATHASPSGTITLALANGTYPYRLGVVPGWTTAAFRGNVTVDETPVTVSVDWTQVVYLVTFHESGLPGGTSWSVDLNGTTNTSVGTTVRFTEPNGTYGYTVEPVTGYTPDTYSGALVVNGSDVDVPISWATNAYPVWFNETGLPAGTVWWVTLNGTPEGAETSSFTFYEPDGSYSYAVGPLSGWSTPRHDGSVTVRGSPVSVAVPWTQVTYNLTFAETNLPLGTEWSVNLSGTDRSTTGRTLTLAEPNGTYPFRVPGIPGWGPSIPVGSARVSGGPTTVTVNWSRTLYGVTFNQTGLPAGGFPWFLNLSGRAPVTAWGASELVRVPNGTYNYSVVTGDPDYAAEAPDGNLTVDGARLNVSVTFARAYPVTFTSVDLPTGTNWSVWVRGQAWHSSNGASITFKETDGAYTFVVGPVVGSSPTPASGPFSVAGAAVTVTITWGSEVYPVTFTETGLPSGTAWSVTVDGTEYRSTSTTVALNETDGTYDYTVGAIPGYTTPNFDGSVTVDGAGVQVTVPWSPFRYAVTFDEKGLPYGTSWSVDLNGSVEGTSAASLTFGEANGTYSYTVGAVPGWETTNASGLLTVDGGPLTVELTWTPPLYPVTFQETGLPVGSPWSVDLNGTVLSSTTTTIATSEPNGTFGYRLGFDSGWSPRPAAGSVTVDGQAVGVTITWTRVVYALTFTETGLAAGLTWSVLVGTVTQSAAAGAPISLPEPNGTYAYSITPIDNWTTQFNGSVVIDGRNASVAVHWTRAYLVTFDESGLVPGTTWSLTLAGHVYSSATAAIAFFVANGSYSYTLGPITGWSASKPAGTVTVAGTSVTVDVTWAEEFFTVTFSEKGLPFGTPWSVVLGGTSASSSTTLVTFSMPDGTYSYTIPAVPGWTAANLAGNVTVSGARVTVVVVWERAYPVTFTETGLPSGTFWSVTLNGETLRASTTAISFSEATGTYTYTVGTVPGYTPTPGSGTVNVTGAPREVKVAFGAGSPGGRTSPPGSILGLPGAEGYEVLGGVLAAVLAGLTVAVWKVQRDRRDPPGPPSPGPAPEPEDADGPPPST